MKAVIYARYSSDNQREESIEGQLRECTAFAEKNGITILRHYIDRAFSAKTDNRPEFQNMIKDSNKKLFDMVIVWKLDRFARNRYTTTAAMCCRGSRTIGRPSSATTRPSHWSLHLPRHIITEGSPTSSLAKMPEALPTSARLANWAFTALTISSSALPNRQEKRSTIFFIAQAKKLHKCLHISITCC